MKKHGCAKAPCKTCPYRRDVPSGVWVKEEYEKLKTYDGEIGEQMMKGATAVFLCHQRDNNLCAGWIATHGADTLLAVRLHSKYIDPSVYEYKTATPVFKTGVEAAKHGMRDVRRPKAAARTAVERLARKRERDGGWE